MATADSVKEKLQGLIAKANSVTGNTDADLTMAVDALVAGYGQGGGTAVPNVLSVTRHMLNEAWTTDALGNADNFVKTFCNANDTTDTTLYVCYISNNGSGNYYGDYCMFQRYGPAQTQCLNVRGAWTNYSAGHLTSRSFYLSAGAIVTVIHLSCG